MSAFDFRRVSNVEVYEVSGLGLPKGRIQLVNRKVTGVFVDPQHVERMHRALLDFLMVHTDVQFEGKMEVLGNISPVLQWSPSVR